MLSKDSTTPQKTAELLANRGFGRSEITVLEHLGVLRRKNFQARLTLGNMAEERT
ncbi:MAG: hypothetical protein Ct9H300mP28_29760 [Pseudomonadota bacterium]|nr:MAG: hypothetical protein Ct9H300mP28_29760 [Pseudomonadota bacterium]